MNRIPYDTMLPLLPETPGSYFVNLPITCHGKPEEPRAALEVIYAYYDEPSCH